MVPSYLKSLWHCQDNYARDSKINKKESKTERWEDNIKDWTGLELANLSKQLKIEKGGDVLLSSLVLQRPSMLRD